jgi:hypothetical protein
MRKNKWKIGALAALELMGREIESSSSVGREVVFRAGRVEDW